MDTQGDWPTAGQPEQTQISGNSVRSTQSSEAEGGVQFLGHHQITHAQEATLLEMFGVQVRRRGVSQGLEREQAARLGHGAMIE